MSIANFPRACGPCGPHLLVLLTAWLFLCAPVQAQGRGQEQLITSSQLDAWIFQQYGDATEGRRRLEAELNLRVARNDRMYGLSDDQEQQLRLAGQGDIQRFFNRVYAAHEKLKTLRIDRQNINDAFQLTVPLQQELSGGLLGPNSLFAKSLQPILDAEQSQEFDEQGAARRQQKAAAIAKMCVAQLEQSIPMTEDQRERLVQLVNTQIAGKHIDHESMVMRIMYGLHTLPEDQLKAILDEQQVAAIVKRKAQLRHVERELRKRGLLDDKAE